MVQEGIQQYRDYYESDKEEATFFEYLDNLTNRDKIRMMELFEDYTLTLHDDKEYVLIPKREYNPELSLFSNLVLDLVDFKDRVRPLAKDITLMEASKAYQKENVQEMFRGEEEFRAELR